MLNTKLQETIADIAYIAGYTKHYSHNSRFDIAEYIHWSKEFEKFHQNADWYQVDYMLEIEKIKSIPPAIWHKIEDWGRITGNLSEQKKTVAFNLATRVRNNSKISYSERQSGIAIIDLVIEKAPDLFDDIDEINAKNNIQPKTPEITVDLVKKIVLWDKKNKVLRDFEYKFMLDLAEGKKTLAGKNIYIAGLNLTKVKRSGFTIENN